MNKKWKQEAPLHQSSSLCNCNNDANENDDGNNSSKKITLNLDILKWNINSGKKLPSFPKNYSFLPFATSFESGIRR